MVLPWLLKKPIVSGSDEAMEATGEATPLPVQVFLDSNLLLQRAIASQAGNLRLSSEPSLLARRIESQSKHAMPSRAAAVPAFRNSCVLLQASSEFSREAKITEEGGIFSRRESFWKRMSARKRRELE
jgi:hypothetical protein